MPSPIGHLTFPLLIVSPWILRASLSTRQILSLYLCCALLLIAPDFDLLPSVLFPGRWIEFHRNWGHNLFWAVSASLLGAWGFTRVLPHFPLSRAWIAAFSLVLSHLILDSMSYYADGSFIGVPLLYPISDATFHLPFPLFPSVQYASAGGHPLIEHLTAQHYWKVVILSELRASALLCFPLLAMGLLTLFLGLKPIRRHA